MNRILISSLLLMLACSTPVHSEAPVAIAIHGGAGVIKRADMSEAMEQAYVQALTEAIQAGHRILVAGGSSLDAVTAAATLLEDSPLFNAGKGAVFNHEGDNELDAAIMDGSTLDAGAVAGLRTTRNPILAARAVMTDSPHVLLFGEGAEQFARQQGLEQVEPSWFHTQRRWDALQKAKQRAEFKLGAQTGQNLDELYSTIGVVALDQAGRLASGTSTGGLTNKQFGRVGDVPVIGAGTYANAGCAVSATGHGEYFIRQVVAYSICSLMEYRDLPLATAVHTVIHERLKAMGGDGGVIALDASGDLSLQFNTPGMFRAQIGTDGVLQVGIYQDWMSLPPSD